MKAKIRERMLINSRNLRLRVQFKTVGVITLGLFAWLLFCPSDGQFTGKTISVTANDEWSSIVTDIETVRSEILPAELNEAHPAVTGIAAADEEQNKVNSEPTVRNTNKDLFYSLDEFTAEEMKNRLSSVVSFASRTIEATPTPTEELEEENVDTVVAVEVQKITLPTGLAAWRENVVVEALSHIGQIDYVWGGEDLEDGSDCSGFVWAVFDAVGLEDYFGHRRSCQSLYEKMEQGKFIMLEPYEGALPGDIILYHSSEEYLEKHPDKTEYGHCAIYIGNGEVVHMIGKGCVRTPVVFDSTRTDYKMMRVIVDEEEYAKNYKGKTSEGVENTVTIENQEVQATESTTEKKDSKKSKKTKKDNTEGKPNDDTKDAEPTDDSDGEDDDTVNSEVEDDADEGFGSTDTNTDMNTRGEFVQA